jgi:arylamine N-acetyltransferase
MSGTALTSAERSRYLRVLGVPPRAPSLEALSELTAAHLTRVPFENVSKLYRARHAGFRGIPGLSEYLEDIERNALGGTCYSNNYYLHRLLGSLGYDVALCGADMSSPDVHLANIVRIEGREYIVDGGYGAPFLEPMPRDLDRDYEITLGRERYVLRPRDAAGRSPLELHREGKRDHGYLLKPEPRSIDEFAAIVADSYAPTATFMNALAIVRFRPGRSLVLHNLTLIESEGEHVRKERIASAAALQAVVERRFGIPAGITRVAIDGLVMTHDPWGDSSPTAGAS